MKPHSLLDRQIAELTERVQARRTTLAHDTVALKMHAWRCATSPVVVTGALAVIGLAAWMRWRK